MAICRLGPGTGRCVGCERTMHEIASWPYLSDDEKQAVWRRLEDRLKAKAAPRAPVTKA